MHQSPWNNRLQTVAALSLLLGDDRLVSIMLGMVSSDVFSLHGWKGLTELTCCAWKPH